MGKLGYQIGFCLLLFCIYALTAPAQEQNNQEISGFIDSTVLIHQRLDTYLQTYEATGDFSGCVGIYKEGAIWYQSCWGQANYTFEIENSVHTKFKIGSVSKQMTAAAIMRLEEMGLLHTSEPINRFFPELKAGMPITIHHLLTHTSGVVDIYELPDFNCRFKEETSLRTVITALLNQELHFVPGTRYLYSNGGYILLAGIIEQVSGIDYGVFLRKEIFEPLQMNASGHYTPQTVVPGLAVGYDPNGYSAVQICAGINDNLLKGAGSLYSSLGDLFLWVKSLKEESLLDTTSYEKLFTDYGHRYGYGLSVYTANGEAVFGHDGRISGYIADYLHYEHEDVSVLLLGNIQTGVSDFLRSDIRAIMKGEVRPSKAKSILPATRNMHNQSDKIGVYRFGDDLKVTVSLSGEKLMARANEGEYSELLLLENGQYFSRTLYATIEFESNTDQKIETLVWINNDGRAFKGQKVD